MAEVQFSGIGVVDMNGSVGGTTFARNYYGAYAKTRIGAPASTPWLAAWQLEVASLSNVWEFGLSDADRMEWYKIQRTAIDSMADKNVITGYDLYMSVNLNLYLAGTPALALPPLSIARNQIKQPVLFTSSTLSFTCFTPNVFPVHCAIYFSKPLPVGRMSNNQIYFWAGSSDFSTTPIDLMPYYTARIGALVAGLKTYVKLVPINQASALRGQPQYVSAIIS